MLSQHVSKNAAAYCHGELSSEESKQFAEHIMSCATCRAEFEEIKLGIKLAEQLPEIQAPNHIWTNIESRLKQDHAVTRSSPRFSRPTYAAIAAVLLLSISMAVFWLYRDHTALNGQPFWQVVNLTGSPTIGSSGIGTNGRLAVGQWLETDGNSRAQIAVGSIGHVDIDPNTRVRLLETQPTEHRLELAEGKLSARIWAPPRLFFVDTPSAVAADLGCAYTLEVDKTGASLLRVTSGWVELQLKDRESMVPAGAACETRPGIGPGTPYFEDCAGEFKSALEKVDFESDAQTRSQSLTLMLQQSRPRDTLTLWHLLARVDGDDRVRVFERIASFVPPPQGVTREGILQLDREMLDRWRLVLESSWSNHTLLPKEVGKAYWQVKNGVDQRMKNPATK